MVTEMTELEKRQRREKGITSPTLTNKSGADWEATLGALLVIGLPLLIITGFYYGFINI